LAEHRVAGICTDDADDGDKRAQDIGIDWYESLSGRQNYPHYT
jgi:hypothetical protein